MGKFLRRLLKAALIVVAVFVLLMVAVRVLVPASRLATMIAGGIEEATGASATFAGAKVDIWPRLRLVLSDGAVIGTGEALEARTGTEVDLERGVVSFRKLEVSLAWKPLLKRRVEVGEVRLIEPDIEIVIRGGTPSPTGGGSSGRAGAGTAAADRMPVALFVAGLSVVDGRLQWSDPAAGRDLAVEGWQQDVSIGDASRLLRRLDAFASGAALPAMSAEPSRVEVRTRIASLHMAGYSEAGDQVFRDLDLTGQLEIPAAADRLQFLVRHLTWSGVTVTGSGALAMSPLGDRLTGEWRLIDLEPEALRGGLPDVAPSMSPETAAWLAETPLSLGGAEATGSFDLAWPLPSGAGFHDLAPGLVLEARVSDLSFVPPRQVSAWNSSAVFAMQGAAAELKDVRVHVLGGRLAGHARFADLDRERPLCSFAVDGGGVPVRALLESVAPVAIPYLEGVADLKLAGALTLGEPEEMRDSLELGGDLALNDGLVHASSWLDGVSPYLGARQDLKDIRFRHLVQRLLVRDGKLFISDLILDGHDTDWRGGGWLGLDGGIEMSLNVKFPEDFQPELGDLTPFVSALRGDDGRIALNLDLRGRASSPRVTLDLSPAKERLSEGVEDRVKGFLDKLKGNE